MNETHSDEDFELLRLTEFTFGERMRYVKEEREHLYTTDHNRRVLDKIEAEAIATRKAVYVALGLEEEEPEILY